MESQFDFRPRNIGEILDASVRLYRKNFWNFLGIVAVIQVPILVITILFTASVFQNLFAVMDDPLSAQPLPLWQSVLSNVNGVVSSMAAPFSTAALSVAVVTAMFGRKLTFREAYSMAFKRWQSIIGAAFLSLVMGVILGLVAVFTLGTLYGAALFYTLTVAPLLGVLIMLERQRAWDVIERAWRLVRDHFWRALIFALLVSLLVAVVQIGPASLLGALLGFVIYSQGGSFADLDSGVLIGIGITAVTATLGTIVTVPYYTIALVQFYFDIRVRDEGFDLYVAATQFDDPLELVAEAPRATPEGKAVRRVDVKRSAGLGCGFVLLIIALYAALLGIVFAFIGVL